MSRLFALRASATVHFTSCAAKCYLLAQIGWSARFLHCSSGNARGNWGKLPTWLVIAWLFPSVSFPRYPATAIRTRRLPGALLTAGSRTGPFLICMYEPISGNLRSYIGIGDTAFTVPGGDYIGFSAFSFAFVCVKIQLSMIEI